MVGAAGFEPTITGSKPDALPLGYAPIYKELFDRCGFYPLIFTNAMRFYGQKAKIRKLWRLTINCSHLSFIDEFTFLYSINSV